MSAAAIRIRAATVGDSAAIRQLLPRLAAFELPPSRNPDDLWRHDAALLDRWATGSAPDCLVHVATDDAGLVLGVVVTSLKPELLSSEPSAHLEAIAVAAGAERRGIASALIEATEAAARSGGARSMTLHVFGRNAPARALYARHGYDEEIIRCSKSLEP